MSYLYVIHVYFLDQLRIGSNLKSVSVYAIERNLEILVKAQVQARAFIKLTILNLRSCVHYQLVSNELQIYLCYKLRPF